MSFDTIQFKSALFKPDLFKSASFKTLSSASVFIFAGFLLAVQTATQPANGPSIEQRVVAKIQQTGKGVILGIAAHGEDVTALADKLLTEVESNQYYAPVFIASEGLGFQKQLKQFGLAQDQLPAVIYFNQQGIEISRTVKVRAITNAVYHTTNRTHVSKHQDAKGADYLVALSQVLSML